MKNIGEHPIQKHILYQLMLDTPRRYSELKPKSVEGNVFMYHVRRLVSAGLIKSVASGYDLTEAGLRYVDTVSLETKVPRVQPKIVTQIACQNKEGKWLLYCREREPFKGRVGFPYGKIHLGEKVQDAAVREFSEKTGLNVVVEYAGDVYITVYRDKKLISHMLAHIFSRRL